MDQKEKSEQKNIKPESVQPTRPISSSNPRDFHLNKKIFFYEGQLHPNKEIEDTLLAILKINVPSLF